MGKKIFISEQPGCNQLEMRMEEQSFNEVKGGRKLFSSPFLHFIEEVHLSILSRYSVHDHSGSQSLVTTCARFQKSFTGNYDHCMHVTAGNTGSVAQSSHPEYTISKNLAFSGKFGVVRLLITPRMW